MTNFADFWNWLWSDWGKPNFLTRLRVPRVVITLVTYTVILYIVERLLLRYTSEPNRQSIHLFIHDPFFRLFLVDSFICIIAYEYVDFRYGWKRLQKTEGSQLFRNHWRDPILWFYWITAIISLLLFLIGGLRSLWI